MTYTFFQEYWWLIVSLLAGLFVMLMFVQGGQTLVYALGHTEQQRRLLLLATGRKWELTFTTLVTFGGAFFASFPLFYSTSFGGAYWVWMLILLCFVIQAVSYEFQLKQSNLLGTTTYRVFLMVNGLLGPLLVGTAVGTLFFGAEFIIDKQAIVLPGEPRSSPAGQLPGTGWKRCWMCAMSCWGSRCSCSPAVSRTCIFSTALRTTKFVPAVAVCSRGKSACSSSFS